MVDTVQTTETEARILRAATEVFRTRGRDGARMQDIADVAGINKAMLHYYFRSKDKLFERVFRDSAVTFFTRIREVLSSDDSLNDKIHDLCAAYMDIGMQEPFIPVFIVTEINRNPEDFIRRMFQDSGRRPDYGKFRELVDRETAAGNIIAISVEQLIINILSLSIFPFIARPMMQFNLGLAEERFKECMEERKKLIPDLIIRSIQTT
jgi:TetR/AcrR family transcriptional regulator